MAGYRVCGGGAVVNGLQLCGIVLMVVYSIAWYVNAKAVQHDSRN